MEKTKIKVECPFDYGYRYLKELVEEWNKVEPSHKLVGGMGSYEADNMPIHLVQDIFEHFNGGENGPQYNVLFKVYDPPYTLW